MLTARELKEAANRLLSGKRKRERERESVTVEVGDKQ
jgi:hypothetical protein